MRKLLFLLLLILVPLALSAQEHHPSSDNTSDVAHGSEKAAHEVAHPNEEHGGHEEAPKTYFGIPGWILKLANMLLFLGVLWYLVRKPVAGAFAARSEQIRTAAQEAKERRAKADSLAADIQARLTQIEEEVRAIHERAEAEGERQKRELIAAGEAEAQKILASARTEVDNRLKHARKELTEYAGQLAAERAEQILSQQMTESDQHKLFRDSLREVKEVQG